MFIVLAFHVHYSVSVPVSISIFKLPVCSLFFVKWISLIVFFSVFTLVLLDPTTKQWKAITGPQDSIPVDCF